MCGNGGTRGRERAKMLTASGGIPVRKSSQHLCVLRGEALAELGQHVCLPCSGASLQELCKSTHAGVPAIVLHIYFKFQFHISQILQHAAGDRCGTGCCCLTGISAGFEASSTVSVGCIHVRPATDHNTW